MKGEVGQRDRERERKRCTVDGVRQRAEERQTTDAEKELERGEREKEEVKIGG